MDTYEKESGKRLLDNFPVGAAVYRVGDRIQNLFCCDAAIKMCGYSREEYDEKVKNNSMEIIYKDDRQILKEEIEAALKEKRDVTCAYRIYHKDGSLHWHQLTAMLAGYDDGLPVFNAAFLDVTQSRKELEEFRYRAEHDALTGVYNKQKFFSEAKKMLKDNPGQEYVLLRADIYRFKIINDIFGRETGDKILKELGKQLMKKAPAGTLYARFEGDDFVVLISKEKLKEEMFEINRRKLLEGLKLNLNVVVYTGIYEIEDRNEPIELMCDRAQMALREIKGDYMKRYTYYRDSLRKPLISEQEILADMKDMIEREQLTVYYQPVYHTQTGEPISAEALVRWKHPRKGLLPPSEFIPYFEQTGFVSTMDQYVWEQVIKFLKERLTQGKKVVPVSVNVSRINLYSIDFFAKIKSLIKKYELAPSYLRLEITETAYMDSQELFMKVMKELHEYGFTILMDDFGTGYSSLTMLKNAPVDVLKLDQQFIKDLGTSERADQIVLGIIHIARNLGIELIAEGVETKKQFDFIKKSGCSAVQGFYFSRPACREVFEQLLDSQ